MPRILPSGDSSSIDSSSVDSASLTEPLIIATPLSDSETVAYNCDQLKMNDQPFVADTNYIKSIYASNILEDGSTNSIVMDSQIRQTKGGLMATYCCASLA